MIAGIIGTTALRDRREALVVEAPGVGPADHAATGFAVTAPATAVVADGGVRVEDIGNVGMRTFFLGSGGPDDGAVAAGDDAYPESLTSDASGKISDLRRLKEEDRELGSLREVELTELIEPSPSAYE